MTEPQQSKWRLTLRRALVSISLFCIASACSGYAIARTTAWARDPVGMTFDKFLCVPCALLYGAAIGCIVGYKWTFVGALIGLACSCVYLYAAMGPLP